MLQSTRSPHECAFRTEIKRIIPLFLFTVYLRHFSHSQSCFRIPLLKSINCAYRSHYRKAGTTAFLTLHFYIFTSSVRCKHNTEYLPKIFHCIFFCLRFGASPFNFTVSLSYISCGKTLHKRQISSSSSPNRHTVHVKTRTESEFLREAKIE